MELLYYLTLVNLLSFFIFGLDKWFAIKNKNRLSEKLLLFLSLIGGCFGMALGMILFHHKTKKKKFLIGIPLIITLWIIVLFFKVYSVYYGPFYQASDFGIEVVTSMVDYNQNGIDDYKDILLGAQEEAKRHPKYKSAYYSGGYPPITEGVCTDLVIRAVQHAGYELKELVDRDIANYIDDYPRVNGKKDPNIDFRRVKNLKVFFEKNTISLTNDINKIEEWMPGDMVIFGKDFSHIGIISDKRNKKGIPYLIHNAGQKHFEENTSERWSKTKTVTGHYRFQLEGRTK